MKFFVLYSITLMCYLDTTYGRAIDASPSFFHSITTSRSKPDISNRYKEMHLTQIKADLDSSYNHGQQEYKAEDVSANRQDGDANYDQVHDGSYESNDDDKGAGSETYGLQDDDYSHSPTSAIYTSIPADASTDTPVSCSKLLNVKANALNTPVALCLL